MLFVSPENDNLSGRQKDMKTDLKIINTDLYTVFVYL